MKLIRVTFFVSMLAGLGGCVAVPVSTGYDGAGYYAPAPAYYPPRVYFGPSIGIGIYGGRHGYGRSYRYR